MCHVNFNLKNGILLIGACNRYYENMKRDFKLDKMEQEGRRLARQSPQQQKTEDRLNQILSSCFFWIVNVVFKLIQKRYLVFYDYLASVSFSGYKKK